MMYQIVAVCLSVAICSRNTSPVASFTPSSLGPNTFLNRPAFILSSCTLLSTSQQCNRISNTALSAVKGKKKTPAAAALEKLSFLDDDEDESSTGLSKKELKQLAKQQKKSQLDIDSDAESLIAAAAAAAAAASPSSSTTETTTTATPTKVMSKKEEMLLKALELEKVDADRASQVEEDDTGNANLSKKELKALQKKEEKMAEKMAAKLAKKASKQQQSEDDEDEESDSISSVSTPLNNDDQDGESLRGEGDSESEITLEDKIRKERPPPRIRVMESPQPGYTSLRLENVGITFRNQEVLKDVTWGVQTGDRIGLVGANGAGKTTQIRILAGELEPTTGDVVKSSKDLRVAVLRQEFVEELIPDRTLKEEFLSVFKTENKILADLENAQKELESMDPNDADKMYEVIEAYQKLENLAQDYAVYTLESRAKKVMDLMGFTDDEADDLVASFSGGWKMRIGLGKTLLMDPNVLLLDEPTNHLDLDSVEWLEEFLRQQNIPMIIVSHDREFLDRVCTKIVDAEGGICTEYDGNYSRFLQLKTERMDAWWAAYDSQEKKIKEERQWINKFKVKQPQAVKQRQAKLEKLIASSDYIQKPPFVGKPFKFRFPDAPRLSPEVAECKGLSHAYRNEQIQNRLLEDAELFMGKGDRIAVVGPNGSGKSTLLRLLTEKERPDEGIAQIVGQNVVMNYFEQNQADALDLSKTVMETIQGASNGQSYNELRALLGQFIFKGDAVEKKVMQLSGGEKARLSLCCMMLRPANFLILDEPTNHLDIPAKEMLEEALQHFMGSVLVVSHDRFFISRVATSIVAIEQKKLVKYEGDYKFYMDRSKEMKAKVEARYVAGTARIESAPVVDLEEIEKSTKKKNFGGASDANLVNRKDKGIKNAKRLVAK